MVSMTQGVQENAKMLSRTLPFRESISMVTSQMTQNKIKI